MRLNQLALRSFLHTSRFIILSVNARKNMAENNPTDIEHPMRIATRVFKGILMWQNEAEDFETMETRDDDIWICTFPRSGRELILFWCNLLTSLL